jgi:hypothetical protein
VIFLASLACCRNAHRCGYSGEELRDGRDRSLVGIRFEALRSVVVYPSSLLFVLLLAGIFVLWPGSVVLCQTELGSRVEEHIRAAARFSCLVSDRAWV